MTKINFIKLILDHLPVVGSLLLILGVCAYFNFDDRSLETVYGIISGMGFGCITLSILGNIRSAKA